MEVSREEFYRALGGLKDDLREDLHAITARLDKLNGRTGKNEVEVGKLDTRLRSAEQKIYRRRLDDDEDDVTASDRHRRDRNEGQGEAWAESTVSHREKALIGFGLVVLTVMIKVLEVMGSKLWEVLTVHKP